MNLMNISAVRNQRQALIKRNFDEIYKHEMAHKRAAGALAGAIVIERNAHGIPIGGHVSIKMPTLNPKNPKKTIDNANTVIEAAMAPSDPSAQDYRVASRAHATKSQAQILQLQRKLDYFV